MKTLKLKAVLLLTEDGKYFIHGVYDESVPDMFKRMQALWNFNPESEVAHVLDIEVQVPEFEKSSNHS